MIRIRYLFFLLLTTALWLLVAFSAASQEDLKGKYKLKDFESARKCKSCHPAIYEQWTQAMMSQAYTHHWDEIEYFDLAVAHANAKPELKDAVDGCNGCHTPMAFMSMPLPPPRPGEKSMANESVSCEACHLVQSASSDPPFNYSYVTKPGTTKYAGRQPAVESPAHKIVTNEFYRTTEFCGNCHNEKNPFGVWVKSTQLEWKEGPYSKEGVRCQDCHMPKGGPFLNALMTKPYDDARIHLFHGAHDPGKVGGAIELRIHPDIREAEPGEAVVFTVALFNQKTGHKFPTGSVEDRIAWLQVEATDAKGKVYHLNVDRKGFEGEEYTISGDYLAYTDLRVPLGKPDFRGVQRDGIPYGNRIFRMPYFDPDGVMTMMQWNTATLGTDYRIGPRETKVEKFTFRLPFDVAPGEMKVRAVLNYQLLVKPVADLLNVPADESAIIKVNEHSTSLTILP
ncbi:MAG TPA: multiheme c-type cytochrome [Bacteroidales bacterium]|nr:multiheme c-type cytochrome [Bacteroidales bacterium]